MLCEEDQRKCPVSHVEGFWLGKALGRGGPASSYLRGGVLLEVSGGQQRPHAPLHTQLCLEALQLKADLA